MPILVSDLDGTLIDIRDRFLYSQINALANFGYTISFEQVEPFVEIVMNYERFLDELDVSLSQKDYIQYLLSIEQEFYKGWQHSYVFPGVIEALKSIRPQVDALRLITSRAWVEETRTEVQHFGLDQVFDRPVFTRGDLARQEGIDEVPFYPYADHRQRLIQLAIADLTAKDDVWVIGDFPNEMQVAQSLGFTTVGVLTGFINPEALYPYCTHIIDSVAEIGSLL